MVTSIEVSCVLVHKGAGGGVGINMLTGGKVFEFAIARVSKVLS